MAPRSLPDPLSKLIPQPPETHPKSHPLETPLLQQGSDAPNLPIHTAHEAFPMRNISQQHFFTETRIFSKQGNSTSMSLRVKKKKQSSSKTTKLMTTLLKSRTT
jgi:hypothetical protein